MKIIKKQKGISLVSAIFIITVLALLGSYMLKMASVQHLSAGIASQGVRAHFAAVSAMEWASWLATKSQADHDSICDSPAKTTSFQFTGGALSGFSITVTCNDHGGFQEASQTYEVDAITVEASKGSGNDSVYRKITATISRGESF